MKVLVSNWKYRKLKELKRLKTTVRYQDLIQFKKGVGLVSTEKIKNLKRKHIIENKHNLAEISGKWLYKIKNIKKLVSIPTDNDRQGNDYETNWQ